MNPGILYNESNNTNYEPTVVLDQMRSNADQAQNENATIDGFLGTKTLADIERRAIIATIRACNGNKAASARSLGISEKSIYNKMKRLQISNADLYGTEATAAPVQHPAQPQHQPQQALQQPQPQPQPQPANAPSPWQH
ncbi:MAG: helix-turn-helix domain-containing protein [Planctomycetota bacterium]